MCGRFSLLHPTEQIGDAFGLRDRLKLQPRYNIAPSQLVPVVRCCDKKDHYHLDSLKWGLVPHWAKDPDIGDQMIIARSETAHGKPSFHNAIRYRRCIVPASGFYEWSHYGGGKQPWYIRMKDDSPMGIAGLWESWKRPDGETLETFCILTTRANGLVKPLHDRMPVILPPSEYATWLNRNLHDPQQLFSLYEPCSADLLTAVKVSTFVNSPAHDSPECIKQLI